MARIRVVTVSECDDDIEDSGNPLIVCRVDDATVRRVILLVLDSLAPPATVVPLRRVNETEP